MLLTDFRQVAELDDQIGALHRELARLYELRVSYFENRQAFNAGIRNNPGTAYKLTNQPAATSPDTTEQKVYAELATSWGAYGITIPYFSVLSKQLSKALAVMNDLSETHPDLLGKLAIILVPPTKQLIGQQGQALRAHQTFAFNNDYFGNNIILKPNRRSWRVLVAYVAPQALQWGPTQKILDQQLYKLGAYDTRDLGIIEYLALTLQQDAAIDKASWTLLLKDISEQLVPSVSFISGQYRFELDDIKGLSDNEGFRPAVEIRI